MPDYRLSLTQLDGVDCTIDSKMWEWERVDPLGSTYPGDFDQGLSETDKVSDYEFIGGVDGCGILTIFTEFIYSGRASVR